MKTKFMNYDEAKAFLKPLGLKSKAEYEAWWDANKPDFLPRFPEEFYSSEPKEKVETTTIKVISLKEKTDLIRKVAGLNLSMKHDKLFQKILVKGSKNWSDNDIEFLMLLVDIHCLSVLNVGGFSMVSLEQKEKIRKETETKREIALKRLTDVPYSLWLKNLRNYK